MSGEQMDCSIMMAIGVFVTLLGLGQIDLGLPDRGRRLMRKLGPVIVLIGGFLLASTYLR